MRFVYFFNTFLNTGLSIQGRGQQKNRRVWVLVRRKALRLVDAELDQLMNEDEERQGKEEEGNTNDHNNDNNGNGKESKTNGSAYGNANRARSRSPPSTIIPTTPMVAAGRTGVGRGFRRERNNLKVTPISTIRKTPPSSGSRSSSGLLQEQEREARRK